MIMIMIINEILGVGLGYILSPRVGQFSSAACKTPTAIITVKKYFKIPPDKNLCVWSQYVRVYT